MKSKPCDDGDRWDCEAYRPEARKVGALCFVAGKLNARVCTSQDACRVTMAAERQRVFRRMNETAAHGDEVGAYLAEMFTNPDQILGGDDAGDD